MTSNDPTPISQTPTANPKKSILQIPLKELPSTGILILTGFCSIFLFFISLILFGMVARRFYQSFGFHSETNEVFFWRFAAFCILPLLFNALFAAYFGLLFARSMGRTEGGEAQSASLKQRINPLNLGLIALIGWFLLFNLPSLWIAFSGFQQAGWEALLRRPLIGAWPPPTLPGPVRIEFMLFSALGNLGLLAGFSAGLLAAEIRRLRALRT